MDDTLGDSIRKAHAALPPDCRYPRATDQQLRAFESTFGPIPPDYRWYLTECGGGVCGPEWLDGIDQLPRSHAKFRSESRPGGWTLREVFLIGWDGAGNPIAIHIPTGKVLTEGHAFGGIHVLADSFPAFAARGLLGHA